MKLVTSLPFFVPNETTIESDTLERNRNLTKITVKCKFGVNKKCLLLVLYMCKCLEMCYGVLVGLSEVCKIFFEQKFEYRFKNTSKGGFLDLSCLERW